MLLYELIISCYKIVIDFGAISTAKPDAINIEQRHRKTETITLFRVFGKNGPTPLVIGVGRFIILGGGGGARFRILGGGAKGGKV